MVKDEVTIQEAIDFFNSLIKIDQQAVTALFSMRIACNMDMRDHDTVQVGTEGNYSQVGMIGILNGLFGKDKYCWGHICADYDNGMIKRFKLLSENDVKIILDKKE